MAEPVTEATPREPGWSHWRREVDIHTELAVRTVHDRIERLLRDGPRTQGLRSGGMEGDDRFRAVIAGNKTCYDVVVCGEIRPSPGGSRIRLTFDSDTSLNLAMIVVAALGPVQVALGNVRVDQALVGSVFLAVLFVVMAHVLTPALFTSRIRKWIERALD